MEIKRESEIEATSDSPGSEAATVWSSVNEEPLDCARGGDEQRIASGSPEHGGERKERSKNDFPAKKS